MLCHVISIPFIALHSTHTALQLPQSPLFPCRRNISFPANSYPIKRWKFHFAKCCQYLQNHGLKLLGPTRSPLCKILWKASIHRFQLVWLCLSSERYLQLLRWNARLTFLYIKRWPISSCSPNPIITQNMTNLQNAVRRLQIFAFRWSHIAYYWSDILKFLRWNAHLTPLQTKKIANFCFQVVLWC